jgi:catechol 2,3-dioxygenase-like lactoylglutathione lyase family enzyme
MQVQRIGWLGTRTERYDELVAFYRTVLGLEQVEETDEYAAFRLANGDHVEVFRPQGEGHAHLTTGPVAGFVVDDIEAAHRAMQAAGVELLSPLTTWSDGQRSVHFRAPDGNVYELVQVPLRR